MGVWWWVYKMEMVLRVVARLTASKEAASGSCVSDYVVALPFGGWVVGV